MNKPMTPISLREHWLRWLRWFRRGAAEQPFVKGFGFALPRTNGTAMDKFTPA